MTEQPQTTNVVEIPVQGGPAEAEPELHDAASGNLDVDEVAEPSSFASLYPGEGHEINPNLASAIRRLEQALGMPVWNLIQPHEHHNFAQIDEPVRALFYAAREQIAHDGPVALVLDSPGGNARSAYEIARLFQRRCKQLVVVVPRYAKSAATLMSFGADRLIMGPDAELGPLDAQLLDMDREDWSSALDEVQALERLNVAALEQVDQAMMMLVQRTGKKIDTLMPQAMKYTTDMMRPLLENIDTVHYIKQSRVLKVGEDYAVRLLTPRMGPEMAAMVASHFVNSYSEHGFVIDRNEAGEWLHLDPIDPEIEGAVDALSEAILMTRQTVIGRLEKEEIDGAEQAPAADN